VEGPAAALLRVERPQYQASWNDRRSRPVVLKRPSRSKPVVGSLLDILSRNDSALTVLQYGKNVPRRFKGWTFLKLELELKVGHRRLSNFLGKKYYLFPFGNFKCIVTCTCQCSMMHHMLRFLSAQLRILNDLFTPTSILSQTTAYLDCATILCS